MKFSQAWLAMLGNAMMAQVQHLNSRIRSGKDVSLHSSRIPGKPNSAGTKIAKLTEKRMIGKANIR